MGENIKFRVLRLPAAVSDAYQGGASATMKEKIEKFNRRADLNVLSGKALTPSGSTPRSGASTGESARVMCRPIFDAAEAPVNPANTALLADVMTKEDFESKVELLDWQLLVCFSSFIPPACKFSGCWAWPPAL